MDLRLDSCGGFGPSDLWRCTFSRPINAQIASLVVP